MPLYVVYGDSDSIALAWLKTQKDKWVPGFWQSSNIHRIDAREIPFESLSNLVQSYPMGSPYRVVILDLLDKNETLRKKKLPELLKTLIPTTIVILWFVPAVTDPKKLPLGAEWKELLKSAEILKFADETAESPSVFTLLDGLGERKAGKALGALQRLIREGEPPVRILMTIVNQMRLLWQLKSMDDDGKTQQEMAKTLGIHPFRVKKGRDFIRNFKPQELPRCMDWLRRADFTLKTGKQEPVHLLEVLVTSLCRK